MLGNTTAASQTGRSMIRRSSASLSTLFGAALTVVFVAGCGAAATTATPTRSAAPALSPSGTSGASPSPSTSAALSTSAAPSGSAGPSGSASPSGSAAGCGSADLGLPHVEATLEDLLPSTIGGICLEKFSLILSTYVASTTGGDRALYSPWLVKFGKTSDDVNMAVASDLTRTENFAAHAIRVPGVTAANLSSSFAAVARAAGWPVNAKTVAGMQVLEIIDPAAQASGGLYAGYVYARNDVLYTIITDDDSLVTEAMIKLQIP
jgi:hypothetical protein